MRKNIATLTGISIVTILVIGGAVWHTQRRVTPQGAGTPLLDKSRQLTSEQREIYLNRIKTAKEDLRLLDMTDPNAKNRQINDYIYLGQQYFGLGQLEQSKSQYMQVLELEPNQEAALMGLAVTYMDAGEYGESRTLLDKVVANNPKNYNAWLQLIDIRKAMGADGEEIGHLYIQALDATDRHVDLITRYAQFLESIGDIEDAITMWSEAIQKNPAGTDMYNQEISRLKRINR